MTPNHISEYNEKSLHAQLKAIYSTSTSQTEAAVDGWIVDVLDGDLCIEIQTGNLSAIKHKLEKLLENHRVLLVIPIARDRTFIRLSREGEVIPRGPVIKHHKPLEMFNHLIHIPHLLGNPNLIIDLVLIREEVVWQEDDKGSWRRKGWIIADRRLVEIINRIRINNLHDLLSILQAVPLAEFTNQDLAESLNCNLKLAGRISYTFRKAGVFEDIGKKGRYRLMQVADEYYPHSPFSS